VGWKWAPIGGLQYQTHMQAPKYDVQFLRSEVLRSSSSSSSSSSSNSSSRTRQIKECYIKSRVCLSRILMLLTDAETTRQRPQTHESGHLKTVIGTLTMKKFQFRNPNPNSPLLESAPVRCESQGPDGAL